MSEKMDFAGGKYTVITDNGKLTALRYGEPWERDEDLVGDNLVYSMLVDSLCLKEQRDALLEALRPFAETDLTNPTVRDTFGFDVLFARAAIAKAEGKP